MTRFFCILLSLGLLAGCSKDPEPATGSAPTVEIQAPTENSTESGEVAIRILVTGEPLRSLQVFIRHADTDALLFAEAPTIDNPTNFLYIKTATIGLTEAAPLLLNVIAEGTDGRRANLTRNFQYAP